MGNVYTRVFGCFGSGMNGFEFSRAVRWQGLLMETITVVVVVSTVQVRVRVQWSRACVIRVC